MLVHEKPRWLRDLLRFLPLKQQFVLSGNVRDLQLSALSDSIVALSLAQVLASELRIAGYTQVISYDPIAGFQVIGTPVITGYTYGSACDWAKLGLLYAQGVRVNGVRVFSEEYARFSDEPTKGFPDNAYGAMVWLNGSRWYSAPEHVTASSASRSSILWRI